MVAFVMKSASTQRWCDSAVGKDYDSISQMALLKSSIAFENDRRKEKQREKKAFPYLGTPVCTIIDEFLEKFQRGEGGSFPIQKISLQNF